MDDEFELRTDHNERGRLLFEMEVEKRYITERVEMWGLIVVCLLALLFPFFIWFTEGFDDECFGASFIVAIVTFVLAYMKYLNSYKAAPFKVYERGLTLNRIPRDMGWDDLDVFIPIIDVKDDIFGYYDKGMHELRITYYDRVRDKVGVLDVQFDDKAMYDGVRKILATLIHDTQEERAEAKLERERARENDWSHDMGSMLDSE